MLLSLNKNNLIVVGSVALYACLADRQECKIIGHKALNLNMVQSKVLHYKVTFVFMLVFMGCMSSEHKLYPQPDRVVIATARVRVMVIIVL